MSYTQLIREYLTSLPTEVPAEVLNGLTQLDTVCDLARDVVVSADNTGCDSELTVCNGGHVDKLKVAINQMIDAQVDRMLCLNLTVRDDDGCAVDSTVAEVSLETASNVVDIALDLTLTNRKNQPLDEGLAALEELLVQADLLPVAITEKSVPADQASYRRVLIKINTDGGLADAFLQSATDYSSGARVLVNFDRIMGCDALELNGIIPNPAEYGMPVYASLEGANDLARNLGFYPVVASKDLNHYADDTEELVICVRVPEEALVQAELSEMKAYADKHWHLNFDNRSISGKRLAVNRFVDELNGIEG